MGGSYGVFFRNCQFYTTLLNELIRVPTSITDLLGGLSNIPPDLVPQVARYRSEEFMNTYLIQLFNGQVPESLPVPIGTITHGMIVPASAILLVHSLACAGVYHFVLSLLVVGLFLHNEKATVSMYMRPSDKLAAQDAFHFGYLLKYGKKSDEFIRKFIANPRLDESDLQPIRRRLAGMDGVREIPRTRQSVKMGQKTADVGTDEYNMDGLPICDVD